MAIERISGALLREMILNGATSLEQHKLDINQLNVFPVPDGDTGTNMALTMASACKEINTLQGLTCHGVADALARGALRGARGNSGVILSQLFRGFARGVDGNDEMDAITLAYALTNGVEMAYKAIMKPREGTILTVSRAVAEAAAHSAAETEDIAEVMRAAIQAGEETLKRTPEMLEVLKKAGVVDAGGKGLLRIYDGFMASLLGEGLLQPDSVAPQQAPQDPPAAAFDTGDIEFGYCTEFIVINLHTPITPDAVDQFRQTLAGLGDSLVVVADDDLIKIHIHTNTPDQALGHALRLGDLSGIKIDNMREQHLEVLGIAAQHGHPGEPAPPKAAAMVAVAPGEGMKRIFKEIMVEGFVNGGQTMNPSAEDIAQVIRAVNAKQVYVLPNNSNIILAARQAAELVQCEVIVVPTKTVPQGIAVALAYDPEAGREVNEPAMEQAIQTVKSGLITYSVRDSSVDGFDIRQGDIMGLSDEGIAAVGQDISAVVQELLTNITDQDSYMISLYWGEAVQQADALALRDHLRALYPQCDVEAYSGGQPVYYYIVSVE